MPLPSFQLRRLVRMYLASQSDPLVAASITAANYCLHSKLQLDGSVAPIQRPDITGSRTALPAIAGRKTGTWSIEQSMAGAGVASTAPDCHPLLLAAFGASGSTNHYTLSDDINTFSLYRYRDPSAVTQHLGLGCCVKDITFTMGSDIAMITASGDAQFVLDTDNFSGYDATWKGGLGSFPSEPSSAGRTYHGLPVIGFTGSITVGGSDTIGTIKSASIKIATGNSGVFSTFGYYIGSGVEGDLRTVSMSLVLDDNTGGVMTAIKQAAFTLAPVDITMVCGTATYNTWTFSLSQVQLSGAKYNDGQRRVQFELGDSQAHGTGLSGLDALSLIIS